MLGKIKKALGIEGVKLELITANSEFDRESLAVEGILKFTTKSDSKVKSFRIKLLEIYSRGRGKKKLTDEYVMGSFEYTTSFPIKKDEIVEIPFTLDYIRALSEMDKMQESNFLTGSIIKFAKKLKGVKSSFKLIAEADVVGTKLDPFDDQEVFFV